MTEHIETDVAIVGAGPVGLFAVFELGMLKLRSVLIDALAEVGGQCTTLYPEKPIYDIPAWPMIEAAELVAQLERQIAPFRPARLLGRRVERLEGTSGAFTLGTDHGDVVRAKAVLLAAGAGAFGPNRPPLEGLTNYEATGAVQYYVRRRDDLRGKRVVIAGGGDSAVDWALALRGIAAGIQVVHRRARFRAAPESAAQLDAAAERGEIELVIPYQLHALHGADGRLAAVEVADLDGATKQLAADVLLPFYGLSMDLGPIAELGRGVGAQPRAGDAGDVRDQRCRGVRHWRCRELSGQIEADFTGVQRGGDGGARDLSDRVPGGGAAFRVFDDQGCSRVKTARTARTGEISMRSYATPALLAGALLLAPAVGGHAPASSKSPFTITNDPAQGTVVDTMLELTCTGTIVPHWSWQGEAWRLQAKPDKHPDATRWVQAAI